MRGEKGWMCICERWVCEWYCVGGSVCGREDANMCVVCCSDVFMVIRVR